MRDGLLLTHVEEHVWDPMRYLVVTWCNGWLGEWGVARGAEQLVLVGSDQVLTWRNGRFGEWHVARGAEQLLLVGMQVVCRKLDSPPLWSSPSKIRRSVWSLAHIAMAKTLYFMHRLLFSIYSHVSMLRCSRKYLCGALCCCDRTTL
jgi:hypothetical protein